MTLTISGNWGKCIKDDILNRHEDENAEIRSGTRIPWSHEVDDMNKTKARHSDFCYSFLFISVSLLVSGVTPLP